MTRNYAGLWCNLMTRITIIGKTDINRIKKSEINYFALPLPGISDKTMVFQILNNNTSVCQN